MKIGIKAACSFWHFQASFLVKGFKPSMTSAELLALRLRQLEKRQEDMKAAAATLAKQRLKSKEQFEQRFHARLVKNSYLPGTMVLVRNNAIEKSMDRKHKPRYNGPYVVIRRNSGGAYELRELDGAVWAKSIAANRLVPYIARDGAQMQELVNKAAQLDLEDENEQPQSEEEDDPDTEEDRDE